MNLSDLWKRMVFFCRLNFQQKNFELLSQSWFICHQWSFLSLLTIIFGCMPEQTGMKVTNILGNWRKRGGKDIFKKRRKKGGYGVFHHLQKKDGSYKVPRACSILIVQQLSQAMDIYARLRKVMQNNNPKEFAKKLAHALPLIKLTILNELILDLAKIDSENFENYLGALLELNLDINFVSKIRSKDPQFHEKTLLMLVSLSRDFLTARVLLSCKTISLQLQDANGENVLFFALRNKEEENSYQIISSILSKSPELARSRNRHGNSLLLLALKRDSFRIVQLLLKNSADPNSRCSQEGNTALHQTMLTFWKCPEKMKDLILLLLSYRADPNIPNFKGENSFNVAKQIEFDLKRLVNLFTNEQSHPEQLIACENEINSVTKDENSYHSDEEEAIQSSEDELQPFSPELLSQEMVIFSEQCEGKLFEAWEDIENIYNELNWMGEKMSLHIDIIGSFATRLWTPSSDIDIVFTNLDSEGINIQKTLGIIYEILRQESEKLGIKEIFLNSALSFPNIKIELDSRLRSRKLDITIFQKRNNGQKYVRYIGEGLARYPIIKPIFYCLHRILETFQLHNPAKGGLKTYALYLMILQFASYLENESVGQIFIKLVYHYAHCFDYNEELNERGQMTVKLNITDPLNESNNLGGRKTQIEKLREIFRIVDYGFRLAEGRKILDYLFSLHNMFKD